MEMLTKGELQEEISTYNDSLAYTDHATKVFWVVPGKATSLEGKEAPPLVRYEDFHPVPADFMRGAGKLFCLQEESEGYRPADEDFRYVESSGPWRERTSNVNTVLKFLNDLWKSDVRKERDVLKLYREYGPLRFDAFRQCVKPTMREVRFENSWHGDFAGLSQVEEGGNLVFARERLLDIQIAYHEMQLALCLLPQRAQPFRGKNPPLFVGACFKALEDGVHEFRHWLAPGIAYKAHLRGNFKPRTSKEEETKVLHALAVASLCRDQFLYGAHVHTAPVVMSRPAGKVRLVAIPKDWFSLIWEVLKDISVGLKLQTCKYCGGKLCYQRGDDAVKRKQGKRSVYAHAVCDEREKKRKQRRTVRKGMIPWQEATKKPPSSGLRKAVKGSCDFNEAVLCLEKGYLPLDAP